MLLEKTRSRPRERRPRRLVDKAHLAYVATQGCAVPGCRRQPTVHHLRCHGADHAGGRRSSDRFAVPLCHEHHQGNTGVHARGDEDAWWASHGIDPIALAARLWAESHGGQMP